MLRHLAWCCALRAGFSRRHSRICWSWRFLAHSLEHVTCVERSGWKQDPQTAQVVGASGALGAGVRVARSCALQEGEQVRCRFVRGLNCVWQMLQTRSSGMGRRIFSSWVLLPLTAAAWMLHRLPQTWQGWEPWLKPR